MSDVGETFNALKKHSQEKRASNREQSAQMLENKEIPFEEKNHGAHLIVEGVDCYIDFWPGTGRWITRNGERGFGVKNLIKYVEGGGDQ